LNIQNTQNSGDIVGGLYGGDNAISNNVSSSYYTPPTTVNTSEITSSIEATTSGLVNSAVSNVPSDELASLQSASKAISSNGPTATKMPTAATDTINRAPIKEATSQIYNDSRIPLPYSDSTDSKPPKAEVLEQYNDLRAELDVQVNLRRDNRIKYREAVATYGSNSLQATNALRDYKDSVREVESLETAVEAAYSELYS